MDSNKTTDVKKEDLNQIRSEVKLENIKSNYFLRLLFVYLPKRISLGAIKYNKKMQKRVCINKADYKEFSEFYSPKVIELIPLEYEYGKFINIVNKADKPYYQYIFK